MTQTENLVKRIPNDIGGLPAERIEQVDHELEPWEKRGHALADVLDFHKIINTEEKRLTGRCLRLNPKAAGTMTMRLTGFDRPSDVAPAGGWLLPGDA